MIFSLLTAGLIAVVTVDGPLRSRIFHRHEGVWRATGLGLIILFGTLTIAITILIRRQRTPDRSLGSPQFSEAEADEVWAIAERMRLVREKYDDQARRFFANFLLFPELYTVRAAEEARIEEGRLALSVSVTLDISTCSNQLQAPLDSAEKTLLVPVLRIRKGALLDNLKIARADGTSMASLSQQETRTLAAWIISDLFWRAYIDPGSDFRDIKQLTDDQRRIWAVLMLGIHRIGRVHDEYIRAVKETLGPVDTAKDERVAKLLFSAIVFFARNYIVTAEVPSYLDRHLVLNYSKTLPHIEDERSLRDRWRLRIGLRPYRFTIPLLWPFLAMSYHFQMTGPAGQYVEDHYLIRVADKSATPVRQSDFERFNPRPYLRIRHHRGLPNAHFYTRGLNKIRAFGLSTIVTFTETPPGVLGAAAAVSVATSALISVFMVVGSMKRPGSLDSDLPALLLASPAFAASAIGFKTDGDGLLRTSLSGRLGLIASGILSFSSALLYIIQTQGRMTKSQASISLANGLVHFKSVNDWWAILAILSTLSTLYLICVLVARTHRYRVAVERKGMLDNPYPIR